MKGLQHWVLKILGFKYLILLQRLNSFAGAGAGAKTHPVILVKPVPADRKLIRKNILSRYQ